MSRDRGRTAAVALALCLIAGAVPAAEPAPPPPSPAAAGAGKTPAASSAMATVATTAATVNGLAGQALQRTTGAVSAWSADIAGTVNQSVVQPLRGLLDGLSEAAFETSFMLGINPQPPARPPVDGPGETADRMLAATAAPTSATVGDDPTPAVPEANPGPAAPAVNAASAAAEPAAAPRPALPAIDPGLLGSFVFDRGQRNADGSYFVPKTLQRLFELRTERAVLSDAPTVTRIAGRIVPDPQAHGRVEASLVGRILPPPAGLPVIGDAVHKGQVLGYVVPAVGVVDRSQVRRQISQLTAEIRVESENLELLKSFSFVPFRDGKIYQIEQKLNGLRRQRDELLPLLHTRDVLSAPIDGVIASSTAVNGRMTQAGDLVFDIINPDLLWIEAMAPEPAIAMAAEQAVDAAGRTPEGTPLTLAFVGRGRAVQNQQTPVLYRIENPTPDLQVGRPVTVLVRRDGPVRHGIVVRREALTLGADGVPVVWEQVQAETFVPHPVRTQELDGDNVIVTAGLSDGARIAVRGVRLLAQLY